MSLGAVTEPRGSVECDFCGEPAKVERPDILTQGEREDGLAGDAPPRPANLCEPCSTQSFKQCGCGNHMTREQWLAQPQVASSLFGEEMDMRNCPMCDSTLVIVGGHPTDCGGGR